MEQENATASRILESFALAGRVALVTGASRGIGAALAKGLAGAGADLALVARTAEGLKETASAVREIGRSALVLSADMSSVEVVRQTVDWVVEEYGRIDVLVNAAGTQARKPLLEITEDDWDHVQDLNLKAVYFCSQAVVQHMLRQGKGKIINICSLTSTIGIPNVSVYGSAKSGVLGLTRAMAVELSGKGINVNAIAPGYFRTELTRRVWEDPERSKWVVGRTPAGRWGELTDLMGPVVFLASAASDFVTGQMLSVDGGWLAS